MRLGSLPGRGRDGTLVLIAADHRRAVRTPAGIATLQSAIDDWEGSEPRLHEIAEQLEAREDAGEEIDTSALLSPLPRAYQWCDASTYLSHMERIRAARGMELPPWHTQDPILYQSGSDQFLGPCQDIALADEGWGLDLEATIAIVTDDVPQSTTAADAPRHIKLLMLTNDLTLRDLMPGEYAKGVGPYRAKPARAYAPIAVSVQTLGDAWSGRLLHATVRSWVNGEPLGAPDSGLDCAFDFAQLIAYMTTTRALAAGTIIGSGTVSNRDEQAGYSCLAEKRAVETARTGKASTPLLGIGDLVRIEAFDAGGNSLFGAMEQRVVALNPHSTQGDPPMSTSSSTEWISGWTAADPVQIGYVAVGTEEGNWASWPHATLQTRDLGLAQASAGRIGAEHFRAGGTPSGMGQWHCYDLDFEFFYVIKGSFSLENQEGEVHEFGPGDAGYHPGLYWHREHSLSGDLDVVRITSPAVGERIDGRDTPLPDRARTLPPDRTAVYTHEAPENYELGAGPRKFFRYRDLGTRGPTENRIHLHVVRATEPGAGTGWHYHSMAQWFMIVGGDSWIRVEDRPAQHVFVGDTMCIGSGEHMRHNVAPFSGDYAVLEMCVPAEYETVAVDPPDGAAAAPGGGARVSAPGWR